MTTAGDGWRATCKINTPSILTAGVLTDSALEHHRVSRRTGGWNAGNVFFGAPAAAPLAAGARRLWTENDTPHLMGAAEWATRSISEDDVRSKLIQDGSEKTFAVVFEPGEEVSAGLLQFARTQKLSAAHLTAIGAFERVTLGFFDLRKKAYERIAINEQVELLSLVGNIARDDKGDAKLHAHVVVGKSDGSAHGGHLLEAYVQPTLEVVVIESSQRLQRTIHPEFGLALLDLT